MDSKEVKNSLASTGHFTPIYGYKAVMMPVYSVQLIFCNDPFQLLMMVLLLVGFPLMVWASSRITELLAKGEEARVPELLRWLANQKYLEAVYEEEVIPENGRRWRLTVAVIGLVIPVIILCSATAENLAARLLVVLASIITFLILLALLERKGIIPDKKSLFLKAFYFIIFILISAREEK